MQCNVTRRRYAECAIAVNVRMSYAPALALVSLNFDSFPFAFVLPSKKSKGHRVIDGPSRRTATFATAAIVP